MIASDSKSGLPRIYSGRRETWLAATLFVILLVINIVLNPLRFAPSNWGSVLGLAAPMLLTSLAITIPFLAGRGSIDISVGPLVGLINVILVQILITGSDVSSPFIIVPAAIAIGVLAGALNGVLAAIIRIQPIVATLGTYLIFGGLALTILPSPSGSVPAWLASLAGPWSILPVGTAVLIWIGIKCLPFYETLMAVGSEDRAAYTAGVNVPFVRFMAYVLAGLFAGLAALSLTALIGSGDPIIGPGYTLIAIAAVALGGVSLAGGVGGLTAAFLGAADIFLLQSMLTAFNVSTFVLQAVYGAVLVLAVCLNSEQLKSLLWRKAAQS
ncbi:ABC transporter permease [Phyllobacterium sp. 0TCS1.6C]|uniref:ABC transporter permease n=1 Tax=unclassified Phyllobacterium TaxID=2638441 RepID=UPI002263EF63|nr:MULTISPECIES: ABC transporter permease [unclassified Phyllobacterium]MCX8279022.1 ABC transporter permease [Phyllobacterium sp. 0TCS1.6C]MCX8293806.1 ABC transporter permease [Phyllobacterium sp. 0TCS1.6A]